MILDALCEANAACVLKMQQGQEKQLQPSQALFPLPVIDLLCSNSVTPQFPLSGTQYHVWIHSETHLFALESPVQSTDYWTALYSTDTLNPSKKAPCYHVMNLDHKDG